MHRKRERQRKRERKMRERWNEFERFVRRKIDTCIRIHKGE